MIKVGEFYTLRINKIKTYYEIIDINENRVLVTYYDYNLASRQEVYGLNEFQDAVDQKNLTKSRNININTIRLLYGR